MKLSIAQKISQGIGLTVLSLFDGASCGQEALARASIKVAKYYASEIDKYAIAATMYNFPETIQLGNIENWKQWEIEKPDVIFGGSPCQGFSFAGKQLNFDDPRSKLFFVFADILKYYKPEYFILENVRMKKQSQDAISKILGEIYPEYAQKGLFDIKIEPQDLNSSLVSAQNRLRLYWTNIPNPKPPLDKKLYLQDIIQRPNEIDEKWKIFYVDRDKSLTITTRINGATRKHYEEKAMHQIVYGIEQDTSFVDREKAHCIDANYAKGGDPKSYFEKSRRQIVFDRCVQVADAGLKGHESINRVYDVRGKAPTITGNQGGNQEPKIMLIDNHNSQNGLICVAGLSKNKKWIDDGKNLQRNYSQGERIYSTKGKCPTMSANSGGTAGAGSALITDGFSWRKLTPIECERAQTMRDDFTKYGLFPDGIVRIISNSQRYKMIGNGWTIDMIVHHFEILKRLMNCL